MGLGFFFPPLRRCSLFQRYWHKAELIWHKTCTAVPEREESCHGVSFSFIHRWRRNGAGQQRCPRRVTKGHQPGTTQLLFFPAWVWHLSVVVCAPLLSSQWPHPGFSSFSLRKWTPQQQPHKNLLSLLLLYRQNTICGIGAKCASIMPKILQRNGKQIPEFLIFVLIMDNFMQ